MRSSSSVWRTACLAIVGFLLALGLAVRECSLRALMADEGWRPVALPARPLYVASNGDTFWVCGTDEMIAKSADGGQTWQVKHQTTDGEVLLRAGFVGKKIGYAAGTNGLILWTKDGGETWTSLKAGSETIFDISFADDKSGIRHTRSTVQITRDGGATWASIPELQTNKDLDGFTFVSAVVALDKDHLAILLMDQNGRDLVQSGQIQHPDKPGTYTDQFFLFTNDGGKTWKTSFVPSSVFRALVVHNGEYWAFGFEVIEKDKPNGGYSVPLALHSPDGLTWTHGVRAPKEYHFCNVQGCIPWDGAIFDLYHEKPLFTAVPADDSLTADWASAKGTVCSVGPALKCASASSVDTPPPSPKGWQPISQTINPDSPMPGCLACSFEHFYVRKDLVWRGNSEVDFLIHKNGTVGDVKVRPEPPAEIESAVAHAVEAWILDPPREGSAAAEKRQTMKLGMFCFASGGSEQARCELTSGVVTASSWPPVGGVIGGAIIKLAPIDPQLKADILHLFDVMHLQEQTAKSGRTLFESFRPMLLASLPPTASREAIVDACGDKLLASLTSSDHTDRVAATYAKYLSDDDIKGLTKFFETPAGQHFNAVYPQIAGDLSRIGQQLARENMPRILKELCKEYPELQGVAKVCPAPEDKKSLLQPPDLPPSHDLPHAAAE